MIKRKVLIRVISNKVRNLILLKIEDLQIFPFSRNDKGLCFRSGTNYWTIEKNSNVSLWAQQGTVKPFFQKELHAPTCHSPNSGPSTVRIFFINGKNCASGAFFFTLKRCFQPDPNSFRSMTIRGRPEEPSQFRRIGIALNVGNASKFGVHSKKTQFQTVLDHLNRWAFLREESWYSWWLFPVKSGLRSFWSLAEWQSF